MAGQKAEFTQATDQALKNADYGIHIIATDAGTTPEEKIKILEALRTCLDAHLAEGRARIAAAQRKRWAAAKKASS